MPRKARDAHPDEGRRIYGVKVVDSMGVEYQMELFITSGGLSGLAKRLFRSADGTAKLAEGAVLGRVTRTGNVFPVDNPLAVIRRRVRDGASEEVPRAGDE